MKADGFQVVPLVYTPGHKRAGGKKKRRRRTEAKRKWSAQDGARSFNHVIFTGLAFLSFFFFFFHPITFSLCLPPPWLHFPLHLLYSPHRSATIRRTEIQYRFHQAVDSGRFFQSNSQILFLLSPNSFPPSINGKQIKVSLMAIDLIRHSWKRQTAQPTVGKVGTGNLALPFCLLTQGRTQINTQTNFLIMKPRIGGEQSPRYPLHPPMTTFIYRKLGGRLANDSQSQVGELVTSINKRPIKETW